MEGFPERHSHGQLVLQDEELTNKSRLLAATPPPAPFQWVLPLRKSRPPSKSAMPMLFPSRPQA